MSIATGPNRGPGARTRAFPRVSPIRFPDLSCNNRPNGELPVGHLPDSLFPGPAQLGIYTIGTA